MIDAPCFQSVGVGTGWVTVENSLSDVSCLFRFTAYDLFELLTIVKFNRRFPLQQSAGRTDKGVSGVVKVHPSALEVMGRDPTV